MFKHTTLLAAVAGLVFALALGTAAHGGTYLRCTGVSATWATTTNWDPANIPDSDSEAALFDGANTVTTIESGGQTIGQVKVVSPSATKIIMAKRDAPRSLTLSPAASFSSIGIDMSAATVDFAFRNYGDSSSRWLDLNLGSSQQWNITSTSVTGGDLISMAPGPGAGSGPVRVNLGAYTLTTNIGTGRKIDTAYMDFRSTTGGSLIETGVGTLELKRPNTYNGNTTISAGTLKLTGSGSINSSPIIDVASLAFFDVSTVTGGYTLGASQTLKGAGTVTGSMTVAGILAPGASPGTLTLGNTTLNNLNDTGKLLFELGMTGGLSDKIITGSLTLAANLNLADFTFTTGPTFGAGEYTLFQTTGITGAGTVDTTAGTVGGAQANLATSGNNIVLNVIPEPATLALMALGGLGLILGRKRK